MDGRHGWTSWMDEHLMKQAPMIDTKARWLEWFMPVVAVLSVTVGHATQVFGAPDRERLQFHFERSPFTRTVSYLSIFDNSKIRSVPYDPRLISAVASLRSRYPDKASSWTTFEVPAVGPRKTCPRPIPVMLHKSKRTTADTYVILPGSFASLKRGSSVNQTAVTLLSRFGDANIVAFPGYMTPDFLAACDDLPWDWHSVAADIYARLSRIFQKIGATADRTGVVGFSGGGLLTLAILSLDSEKQPGNRLFGLGGIAISPILDAETAFEILDSSFVKTAIEKDLTLTSYDVRNLLRMTKLASRSMIQVMIDTWTAAPTEFRDRFYNEFTTDDLKTAIRVVGGSEDAAAGYARVFNLRAAARKQHTGAEAVKKVLNSIQVPALLWFADDDPVLATKPDESVDPRVKSVIAYARQNPNIVVFNPPFGGHTGATLDPEFCNYISVFFGGKECLSTELINRLGKQMRD